LNSRFIRKLFEMARAKKPSIIFIDEIDGLSYRADSESEGSRRLKTELLVQMSGYGNDDSDLFVIGATNCPWNLDPAYRRRFEKRIYIPLPDQLTREKIIRKNLENMSNVGLEDEEIIYLAELTEG
jgi:vacuolar protein-sorting-associated protein 4